MAFAPGVHTVLVTPFAADEALDGRSVRTLVEAGVDAGVVGLALRKQVLRRRGVIAQATVRSPGPTADGATLAALDRLLAGVAA